MMENVDELIERLAREGAAKPAEHPYVLGLKLSGWALAYLALSLALSGLRPDIMEKLQQTWFVAEVAVLAGIMISTAFSAALLSYPDMHQKRSLVMVPGILFLLFLFIMSFAWHADAPPAPLPVHSFECTLSIILVAVLPAGWIYHAMRKLASTHYQLAGCIALLSAFSVGALWLRLHELNDSILHLVEWHYLPMAAVGLAGLWLGKRLLKW